MREPDALVSELLAVDAKTTSAVLVGDVASLHHEVLNDPVEDVSSVAKLGTLLTRTEAPEVLSGLRHMFGEQFENHSALIEAILALLAYLDVEEGLRVA